jgi:hypothetical protein
MMQAGDGSSNIDVIYYSHIATATTFPLADGKQNLKKSQPPSMVCDRT